MRRRLKNKNLIHHTYATNDDEGRGEIRRRFRAKYLILHTYVTYDDAVENISIG